MRRFLTGVLTAADRGVRREMPNTALGCAGRCAASPPTHSAPRTRTGHGLAAALGVATAVLLLLPGGAKLSGQNTMKVYPINNIQGTHVGLGLAIRKLGVSATFMNTPAHPDDERNALFTTFGMGQGMRVIDLNNNRGEGGQNQIGPEIMHDIGVLRTEELMASHRTDLAEQYFTRSIDYGYSYDPLGEIIPWVGEKEIVGDYVRLYRMLRPDVVLTMNVQGSGGDRMHEAQTILSREAYAVAGDPSFYPEQIAEGLRPWQPAKFYVNGSSLGISPRGTTETAAAGDAKSHIYDRFWFGLEGTTNTAHPTAPTPDSNVYDLLLGKTLGEIGNEGRQHLCQGIGGGGATVPGQVVVGGRGGRGGFGRDGGGYYLVDSNIPGQLTKSSETGMFDGIDTTVNGIARFAGATPPAALVSGLQAITDQANAAKRAFDSGNDAATVAPIEAGLTAVRALRSQLGSMSLTDEARYEIDFRLANEEQDWVNAVIQSHALEFYAVDDDGLVVAGQPVQLTVSMTNRGATPVEVTAVEIKGFDSPGACAAGSAAKDGVFACNVPATIPRNAKATTPYWHDTYWANPVKSNPARNTFDPGVEFGVPFAPSEFRAVLHVKAGSVEFTKDIPFAYHYVKDIYFGDKKMEINVIPAFAAKVAPSIDVVGASSAASTRNVYVAVTNGTKAEANASVTLEVPAGWTVTPATVPLAFTREDESLSAKFGVTVPAGAREGTYSIRAVVTSNVTGAERFSTYYDVVEYPHTEYRQTIKDAVLPIKVINLRTADSVKVGYVLGMGDLVAPAVERLGAIVTLIDENELAWGDLSKYDEIILGVRAYNRADLRAYNKRVLDYVYNGGTVLVNYGKGEFNGFGPYPGATSGGGRVNDETAPIEILVPNHPVFNYPNKIVDADWEGWTQERGQYFMGFPENDPNYIPLVETEDTMADNPGVKLGGLVEAKYGKGRWVYLGLNLWRQLPQGTPGAYRLMANLLALPKAPAAPQ
jgi:LmbE family N-acetylglucosaminyl deacetylase